MNLGEYLDNLIVYIGNTKVYMDNLLELITMFSGWCMLSQHTKPPVFLWAAASRKWNVNMSPNSIKNDTPINYPNQRYPISSYRKIIYFKKLL